MAKLVPVVDALSVRGNTKGHVVGDGEQNILIIPKTIILECCRHRVACIPI